MKLLDILKELENDDDIIKKGFKLGAPEVDPETGKITSSVTYLPKFKQIRIELYKVRDQLRPFKQSTNPDIAATATKISTTINKLNELILVLDGMVELQKSIK
jgi:hypothetical protein